MSSAALPHQFSVDVAQEDIDFMGHVNNASYLKWVQAAVIDHWQRLAPADAVAAHLWVAIKHEITYRRPAFLDDDVVATVLLEKVQGARAFYETVIRRGTEVLAEVKSSWCCVDAQTLRPARLRRMWWSGSSSRANEGSALRIRAGRDMLFWRSIGAVGYQHVG